MGTAGAPEQSTGHAAIVTGGQLLDSLRKEQLDHFRSWDCRQIKAAKSQRRNGQPWELGELQNAVKIEELRDLLPQPAHKLLCQVTKLVRIEDSYCCQSILLSQLLDILSLVTLLYCSRNCKYINFEERITSKPLQSTK